MLLDYFRRCADKYGLRAALRFGTEVEHLEYDDAAHRWRLHVRSREGGRETLAANAVISAVGQLNRPRSPDIPGRERFAGIAFHSARWEHQHDLAGKRMLIDSGHWYQALARPNVRLVTDPIAALTSSGVETVAGDEYAADVLIYGSGFQASNLLSPMRVTGQNGLDLHAHWNGNTRAYVGITIPGFPNLFCLYGPNTNIVVNGSIIFFSECAVRYIVGCLNLLLAERHAAMDCRRDVHDAYNAMIDRGNAEMAWGTPAVTSWYKNARGRVSQNWPLTLLEYWTRTQQPDPGDFVFS